MPRIDEMFAFIAENEPGEEGVTGITVSSFSGSDIFMPLVGADMERMESLKQVAKELAATTGKPIKLVKFSKREEIETL